MQGGEREKIRSKGRSKSRSKGKSKGSEELQTGGGWNHAPGSSCSAVFTKMALILLDRMKAILKNKDFLSSHQFKDSRLRV